MKRLLVTIGLALFASAVVHAQTRDSEPRTQTMQIAPAKIATPTPQGNPAVNSCLKEKLGTDEACARAARGEARAQCLNDVWNACQPDTRMNVPNSIPKLPQGAPTINSKVDPCKTRMDETPGRDGRATSEKKGERMKVNPPDKSVGCKGDMESPAPGRVTTAPSSERACASCSGVCQSVSWLSGNSKFDGIDVGGGQSPSQCIDQIKTQCESGAARYMAAATCKPG